MEIAVRAAAFAGAAYGLQIGHLDGAVEGGVVTFLYFSFSCYTSLGMGDIFPVGGMRLLAGMESLVGLLMIGWSASYLLLEMREFRSLERRAALAEEQGAKRD